MSVVASAPPIVVVGDLMVDVVARASEPLQRGSDAAASVAWAGGGAGANVAAWVAEAGGPVALVARVGDDVAGRAATAELRAAGVDARVTLDPERGTGTCVVLVEPGGERTMLPDRGANLALAAADIPGDLFAAGGHLHVSGYTLLHPGCRPAGLAALRAATVAGMTASVDPASAAPLRTVGAAAFLGWAAGAGLLLPNADEATVLGGGADAEAAARALAAGRREVVVTLGAGGALWTDGATVLREPAVSSAAPLDTTGAGDAFTAGWLAATREGAGPGEALHAACALAGRAVARAGARP